MCRSIRTPISPPGRAITAYREWDESHPKDGLGARIVRRSAEEEGADRGRWVQPEPSELPPALRRNHHHRRHCRRRRRRRHCRRRRRQLCVVDRLASGENLLLRAENQRERSLGGRERQSYGLNAPRDDDGGERARRTLSRPCPPLLSTSFSRSSRRANSSTSLPHFLLLIHVPSGIARERGRMRENRRERGKERLFFLRGRYLTRARDSPFTTAFRWIVKRNSASEQQQRNVKG